MRTPKIARDPRSILCDLICVLRLYQALTILTVLVLTVLVLTVPVLTVPVLTSRVVKHRVQTDKVQTDRVGAGGSQVVNSEINRLVQNAVQNGLYRNLC